ncbi:MAG: hypothetical protein XD73_0398 [Anaerolinea thermophila]|uniref:Uncharacterized protein n=1 Tax=Anaerolinea thermophila TaxID=167964 RepID=A0A101FYC8_9CHLR|nr:MAG: hypothetical protein XD73_0398 [Anaerolinea thermophila]
MGSRSRSSMDRVPDFESVGCAFESRRERLFYLGIYRAILRYETKKYFPHSRIYLNKNTTVCFYPSSLVIKAYSCKILQKKSSAAIRLVLPVFLSGVNHGMYILSCCVIQNRTICKNIPAISGDIINQSFYIICNLLRLASL